MIKYILGREIKSLDELTPEEFRARAKRFISGPDDITILDDQGNEIESTEKETSDVID